MKRCKDYAARYPGWYDWKWQYAHRITTAEEIAAFLNMQQAEKTDVENCLSAFRMAITPYYASLIDPQDPEGPLRKICVPRIQEDLPMRSRYGRPARRGA